MYSCPVCLKGFTRKDSLDRHKALYCERQDESVMRKEPAVTRMIQQKSRDRLQRQHSKLQKLAGTTDKRKRHRILKGGGKDLMNCIAECCVNLANGNIQLTGEQYKELRRLRDPISELAYNKQLATKEKRRIVEEQRGGFLPALLAPVFSTLAGSVLGRLLK